MTAVGKWAAENTAKDCCIACRYIGAVSYYSDRKVLDMHGLTDLHIGHTKTDTFGSGKAGHEKTDIDYILAQEPEYLFSNLKRSISATDPEIGENTREILEKYEQREAESHGIHFFYYKRKT